MGLVCFPNTEITKKIWIFLTLRTSQKTMRKLKTALLWSWKSLRNMSELLKKKEWTIMKFWISMTLRVIWTLILENNPLWLNLIIFFNSSVLFFSIFHYSYNACICLIHIYSWIANYDCVNLQLWCPFFSRPSFHL